MRTNPAFRPGPSRKAARRGAINQIERAAGRDLVGPIDGRNTAMGVHRTIYAVAEQFGAQPDRVDLLMVVGRVTQAILDRTKSADRTDYVLRLRQRLATVAGAYFNAYAPLGPWRYVACEVVVGRHRFDLIWEDPRGQLWVDEIKTRRMAPRQLLAMEAQVPAYARAARRHWGPDFAAVRACPVLTANGGFIIDSEGCRGALVR